MFKLEYAKNPVFLNNEGTAINLVVKWEEFNEEMPFAATSYDPEPHGVDLYNRAKNGEFGEVAPFVPHENQIVGSQPATIGTKQA